MDVENLLMEIWNVIISDNNIDAVRRRVNEMLINYYEQQIQLNLRSLSNNLYGGL